MSPNPGQDGTAPLLIHQDVIILDKEQSVESCVRTASLLLEAMRARHHIAMLATLRNLWRRRWLPDS